MRETYADLGQIVLRRYSRLIKAGYPNFATWSIVRELPKHLDAWTLGQRGVRCDQHPFDSGLRATHIDLAVA
jgi:hypothetical protein